MERGSESSGGVESRSRVSGRSENTGERGSAVYDDGSGDKHNLIVPSDAT